MKKLLFQFDTDLLPSAFDTVVAYDAGVDHVIAYAGLTPETVKPQVEGCIFLKTKRIPLFLSAGAKCTLDKSCLITFNNTFFQTFVSQSCLTVMAATPRLQLAWQN